MLLPFFPNLLSQWRKLFRLCIACNFSKVALISLVLQHLKSIRLTCLFVMQIVDSSYPKLKRKLLSHVPQYRESFHNWSQSSALCSNTDRISFDRELLFFQHCLIPIGKCEVAKIKWFFFFGFGSTGNTFFLLSPVRKVKSPTMLSFYPL